jgi:NAD(P)-dependent dehydrogenase (short-subunit alcohol dehydrogenase family)
MRSFPLLIASVVATTPLAGLAGQPTPGQKAILVTGASTGIGRTITEVLAQQGHFVYAGARKPEDLAALSAIRNVQGIKLDVTIDAEVAAAVATITKAGRGLYGVVNNAGVAVIGPMSDMEVADLEFVFDVNVAGPHRITKAFTPLLATARGRVVNIGSISGILAGPMFGVYAMSKHAVEAYTDAVGVELARLGIKVSVIEPGNYRSEMSHNVARRMRERGQKIEGSLYQKELEAVLTAFDAESADPEPADVAQAAVAALFDPNPKIRYMVVPNQRQANATLRKQIRQLVELNQAHRYSVPRDSLVAMLDRALAELK